MSVDSLGRAFDLYRRTATSRSAVALVPRARSCPRRSRPACSATWPKPRRLPLPG
jgi:hypothetical protein